MSTRSDEGLSGGTVADPWPGSVVHNPSLRSFTQTAQHPHLSGLVRAGPDPRFLPTGMVPAVGPPVVVPAPLLLRMAVWLCVLLVLAGVAGIAVHHFRPAWLRDIESAAAAGPAAPVVSHGNTSTPTVPRSVTASVVAIVDNGDGTGTVAVHSPSYTIVVQATTGACWVSVTGPGGGAPLFEQTLPAGATQSFPSQSGPMLLNLGSSHVTVSVQVRGKTVPGSSFTPKSAPYDLTFTSD